MIRIQIVTYVLSCIVGSASVNLPMPKRLFQTQRAPARFRRRRRLAPTAICCRTSTASRILVEHNADMRVEPASITKLMTAYVVFSELDEGNITLEETVAVSEKAWRTGGSRMFIEPGMQVSVEDLIRGMVIQSGNDASVALAEHVAGSEEAFAGLMNHYAELLGMSETNFMNATGLPDPDHYTTAGIS